MNNCSSGKIDGALSSKMKKETIRCPDPMTYRIIHYQTPDRNKKAIGFKIDSFSKSSCYKSRGNNGKLTLEHCKYIFRNSCIQNICVYSFQKEIIGIPAKPASQDIFPETHAVPHNNPQNTNNAHSHKTMHYGPQHILGTDQSAIKHCKSRDHQQYKCGGSQHPGSRS